MFNRQVRNTIVEVCTSQLQQLQSIIILCTTSRPKSLTVNQNHLEDPFIQWRAPPALKFRHCGGFHNYEVVLCASTELPSLGKFLVGKLGGLVCQDLSQPVVESTLHFGVCAR
jgi:hypothetical protein